MGVAVPPRSASTGDPNRDLARLQDNTEKLLRALATSPIIDGRHIKDIKLVNGEVDVSHGLDRDWVGVIVTYCSVADIRPNTNVTPAALKSKIVRLGASAAATINIWVF